ncbi:MAG: DUF3793 family protein, partial [Kiritimatiellae bacterium]|nr:DUF3793 family protein [Kiritimatiellia bacterium]
KIDELHRMKLLKFLLVKTAAVRCGVKPGELLRVRHCYEDANEEGLRYCLYRSDVYEALGLDYLELRVEEASSLVLFYNPSVLAQTLSVRSNCAWLARFGYRGTMPAMLEHLCKRFESDALPHEIGIFIGYPLKDVVGFMKHLPATPLHCSLRSQWRIYGAAEPSLAVMARYAAAEARAAAAFENAPDLEGFKCRLPPAA